MFFLYALVIISVIAQGLTLLLVVRNYRFVLRKADRNRIAFSRKAALIIPCKGIDTEFEKNITSFYNLDYSDYEMIFVTESESDPAYAQLLAIKEKLQNKTRAYRISVLSAGVSTRAGQKLHNQLFGCTAAAKDAEIFAFADSDACVRHNWLNELTYPLRQEKHGVSSGYRWYVPMKNNFATLAISLLNARVAQLLGATIFNQAWGGSMAIRVETFKKLGMAKILQAAVSDDVTISSGFKKAGRKVFLVPSCFVASYEQTDWRSFFEFARRQFLLTRISSFGTWLFGLLVCLHSVFALWGFTAIAVYFNSRGFAQWHIFLLAAMLALSCQIFTAALRQKMISEIFPADWPRLKTAALADILAAPVWSLLMFICIISSSVGRVIRWRGITYKLISPTQAERI